MSIPYRHLRTTFRFLLTLATSLLIAGAASAQDTTTVGLMVMAHGGTPEWNQAVEQAVVPLRSDRPVAIAFGMADRASLQEAVSSLEKKGVGRIAVVRLFMSGHSFKHQTEYFLGLRPDPPERFIEHAGHGGQAKQDAHAGHSHAGHSHDGHSHGAVKDDDPAHQPITRTAKIALSAPGLDEDPMTGVILSQRAAALSKDPKKESVILIGHGVEDDDEDNKLNARLQTIAGSIAKEHGFADVRVQTLREDWPVQRMAAEQRIRTFVTSEKAQGRKVLVVPVRVFGFGPYKEVLKGLTYTADEKGLLPHPEVTKWIDRQYQQVRVAQGWMKPGSSVPALEGSH